VGGEAFDEGLGIEGVVDAAESDVAGGPVREFEKATQPGFFEFGKTLEVVKALHAANHRCQRDEKDLAEVVALGPAVARIGERFKCFQTLPCRVEILRHTLHDESCCKPSGPLESNGCFVQMRIFPKKGSPAVI
jgi:hypothetical protein